MTNETIRAIDKNDLNKLTVYKDNKLIEAAYNLTLIEQHLILTCIAQINPQSNLSENDEFRVSAENYMELFNVNRNTATKNIQTALYKLGERWVLIKNSNGVQEEVRWIDKKFKYDNGTMVGLRFTKEIIDYLTHLDSFTRYKLNLVSKMTSPNAIRLYEIFVQKTAMGITKINIDVDWLRKLLCISEDKYTSFGDFNTRILIPSIEQINKFSNLTIALHTSESGRKTFGKPLKRGRSIYGFSYVVRYKKGQEHKTLKQAGLEASQNKPLPVQPAVEPVNAASEQSPKAYKSAPEIDSKATNNAQKSKYYKPQRRKLTAEDMHNAMREEVEMGFCDDPDEIRFYSSYAS